MAASGPFGFSAIGIIVNTWFAENQHATATAVIGLADVAGAMATFAIQGILSSIGFFNSDATNETIKRETNQIMVSEGFFIIAIASFLLVTIKEKPELPPSRIAMLRNDEQTLGTWTDIKNLLKNQNYVALMIVYGLLYSCVNA